MLRADYQCFNLPSVQLAWARGGDRNLSCQSTESQAMSPDFLAIDVLIGCAPVTSCAVDRGGRSTGRALSWTWFHTRTRVTCFESMLFQGLMRSLPIIFVFSLLIRGSRSADASSPNDPAGSPCKIQGRVINAFSSCGSSHGNTSACRETAYIKPYVQR